MNNDYELKANIIAKSAKQYESQFNNSNFYVVFYPSPINNEIMVGLLKNKGLKVLDYSILFDSENVKYHIPYDEHPNAMANELLVKKLLLDMQ